MPAAPATRCLGEPTVAADAVAVFSSIPASCGALLTFLIEPTNAKVRRVNGFVHLGQRSLNARDEQQQ